MQSRNQSFKALPPDRGSFPLDHKGVCDAPRQAYVACMEQNKYDGVVCKNVARLYFECRMNKCVGDRAALGCAGLTRDGAQQFDGQRVV